MNKDKLKLIAVISVFVLPIVFAFLLQPLKEMFVEKGSISNGQLITPQIELLELNKIENLKGKWTLISFADKHCDASCIDNVYKMQQIRIATGEGAKRINRMLISKGKLPVADLESLNSYKGTKIVRLSDEEYQSIQTIMLNGGDKPLSYSIYLVDPLGYYMMTFPNSLLPKGIITDLKYLLKNSRIG